MEALLRSPDRLKRARSARYGRKDEPGGRQLCSLWIDEVSSAATK